MRIGLISNARSERNKQGLGPIDQVAASAGIPHLRFDGSRPLVELLNDLAGAGTELLVVNAGDGTVQGTLTALLEQEPFATLPLLAILPRGMANMTAVDVGLRDGSAGTLQKLVESAYRGTLGAHVIRRHVLRVENIAGAPPQRGAFLGAAAIYEAIEICKGRMHRMGLKGEASHAATLAWLLLNAGLRGLDAVGMHGQEIGLSADGKPMVHARRLMLLATTLNRLVLRSRPFWNVNGHPLRFTSIAHPAKGLVRHAREILYGGETRSLPAAMFDSGGAERLELTLNGPFTIDGEFFAPHPDTPLVVTASDQVSFVRL
jgi:hypothetical protein